ncbi:MAG: 3-deoxy-7-phosphoheptulonate synthase [Catenulispora sp.]
MQQPEWDPATGLDAVVSDLRARPPLVTEASCYSLQRELSAVAGGRALIIQAGDCAERFAEATPERMRAKLDLLTDLADEVEAATGLHVVRIGRFAGQYAKPRSEPLETTADGRVLPVYRGDAVNAPEPDERARVADARRLLAAYDHSARALDELFLRDLLPPFGGIGHPHSVTYASHEALLLDYERALIRQDELRGGVYGSSGHFLWIGERTRALNGAHIAFAEQVGNPVGVKVGPDAPAPEVAELISRLAHGRAPGRLSLITRMGTRIEKELPRLLGELGEAARHVLWICDPMHGNGTRNRFGQKTRVVADIVAEIQGCCAVLADHGLTMAGLHLETTPDDVVECVGAAAGLDRRLDRYTTACDPRLNADQAIAVVGAALAAGWGRNRAGADPRRQPDAAYDGSPR